MEDKEPASGIYLYCLGRAGLLKNVAGPGLDGQDSLKILGYQDIAAVWSRVPLNEFCDGEAHTRLQDLTWIAPRAYRHEQVVEEVMRQSPVLPARFGTIFSSQQKLEELLGRHHGIILPFLDQVSDREEWALKVMLDRTKAKEAFFHMLLEGEADILAKLSPGKRYFQEQRLRTKADRELYRWLRQVCQEVIQNLKGLAQDMRERRVSHETGAGGDGRELVSNWALLLTREAVTELRAYLDAANTRYGPQGLVLHCSGPWPPYSFTPSLALEDGA
jgi:hypothetical protein